MLPHPRLAPLRALEVLDPADRATVARWMAMLGMEVEELAAVPPLQQLVDMLATLTLASHMPGRTREQQFREAARRLGCSDQLRTWYRWQDNAVRQLGTREDRAS